ncbi:acetyltransferase domain protein [Methyloversatilis sp. RAC08]|uniref:GNAT family N-acetyltransferase n=1 Tax=Methyloversatilis sp. RAC08 TaxID=1842540 RepID=UPI00083D0A4A|nr:GNAT family N-acetyltransferase [Methyloversatilis sp. RAC08]AOF80489.1 acetyltransferase domain protein [Methyloversatilis sp. RAC08]
MSALTVVVGDWALLEPALRAVREAVFIVEQGIPAELEWDTDDATSRHALACVDGAPVACGRLLPDGHIGRMAVRAPWRGQGIGRAILDALIDSARQGGLPLLQLHAQMHATGFYERARFTAEGPPFDEVGIVHQRMVRALTS